ncbi:MAG: beta-xylosidase [Candidatus Acidiferrum sp.]
MCLGCRASNAQDVQTADAKEVWIRVDAAVSEGPWRPVWSYFGYDEPNYTYAENGKKLLGELRALDKSGKVPVYVRVHNLLTSGDGSSALKWGSTNAYTEDASGRPVYDWKIVDRIFDTFREKGITPLVEVGFMPEALSVHPQPYRHTFPQGDIFTGWAYPPKDYAKWEELVYQFAKHLRERYGDKEVKSWLWEVWNEPDIPYWKGTREEFFKLYDHAAQGILRALPDAKVGGPDTTGAAGANAAEYLRAFLEHCARGTNAATGKAGAPLSFISFHPKGSPLWKGDHVQMRVEWELKSVEKGFEVVAGFPEWRRTPIILGEWDPEGCAACSARTKPENAYRNTHLYAVYTAEALKDTLTLAEATGVNLAGVVTWSFEFEDQPYFEGFRELATNRIDKPVLNAFRMFGMLGGQRVRLTSDAAAERMAVLHPNDMKIEGVDGLATKREREIDVMVWNYAEEDVAGRARKVEIEVAGFPATVRSADLEEFRVDGDRSNSFTAWKKIGSPQKPSAEEYAGLEKAGTLERVDVKRVTAEQGNWKLTTELPQEGIALFRLSW